MDRKIIQMLIHDILAAGEYTLEGIAYYTHIPYDVIDVVTANCQHGLIESRVYFTNLYGKNEQ